MRLQKERGGYLRSRHLQFLLAFSYWPAIEFRKGSHIYELRSYRLKPGTMIEWGNNWARGLRYRRNNDEAFAAFFSQVGRMNQVHHFWCEYSTLTRTCFISLAIQEFVCPGKIFQNNAEFSLICVFASSIVRIVISTYSATNLFLYYPYQKF